MVGQDDAEGWVQVGLGQDRPQSSRHFGSRLDTGQAGAHDDDRKLARGFGSAGKTADGC